MVEEKLDKWLDQASSGLTVMARINIMRTQNIYMNISQLISHCSELFSIYDIISSDSFVI